MWLCEIDKMRINDPDTLFQYLNNIICFFIGHNYIKNEKKTYLYCTRCEDILIIINDKN